MTVHYDEVEGHPANVKTTVKRKISGMVRRDSAVSTYKVGITNDPEVRWAKGYNDDYHEMRVVYSTKTREHIQEMERELIEYYDDSENLVGGGGGISHHGPWYLYVVLAFE